MTIINLQISETDTINNKNQTTGIQVVKNHAKYDEKV